MVQEKVDFVSSFTREDDENSILMLTYGLEGPTVTLS